MTQFEFKCQKSPIVKKLFPDNTENLVLILVLVPNVLSDFKFRQLKIYSKIFREDL
jgi:hypothetical protein